jgi:hypothetical protein
MRGPSVAGAATFGWKMVVDKHAAWTVLSLIF